MQFDQKQLFQIAMEHPYFLFTGEQISELCNVGEDQVRRVRNAPDSPFRYNKCRPEWFTAWMQCHPEIPSTASFPVAAQPPSCERCAEAVRHYLRMKPLRGKKGTRLKRTAKRFPARESRV
jgi:hypothetical protein